MNDTDNNKPETVIIMGAGCSVGLGVPTMAMFLDAAIDKLKEKDKEEKEKKDKKDKDEGHLAKLTNFISKIRRSGAYTQTKILDMEQLYSLADFGKELDQGSSGYNGHALDVSEKQ